jgi:hypothetical protein
LSIIDNSSPIADLSAEDLGEKQRNREKGSLKREQAKGKKVSKGGFCVGWAPPTITWRRSRLATLRMAMVGKQA